MDALIEKLEASNLFDRDWYLATYPDVAQTGMDPMWHFLKYGLDWGRRPGPGFEPDHYKARYPDIAVSGELPLRHYLFHGQSEGRFPTQAAAQTYDGMVHVRRLQAELWGGLPEEASSELRGFLDNEDLPEQVRFEAGCQLAYWLDFTDASEQAEAMLQRLGGMSVQFARAAARQIPLGMLYAKRGATQAARQAFETIRPEDYGSNQLLALANLEDDTGKLARINEVLTSHGLVPLARQDDSRLLSLDNLTTSSRPAEISDGPLVSVIMPTYAAAKTIGTALKSLQAQSHRALEIIVVDDASHDNTADIVSNLAKADPRIRLIRRDTNGGAYAARNRGLAEARGDVITTHDADDWSHPQKIALQLEALLSDASLIGVISHWARITAPFQITTNWRLGPNLLQWSHSSFLFHRHALDKLGAWDEVKVSADMDFIWRAEAAFGRQSLQRIHPDLPLAFALDEAASLTRNPLTHVRSSYHGLRHYYREISRYWAEVAPDGLTPDQQRKKRAMLPDAIRPGRDGQLRADLLIRLDACNPEAVAEAQTLIEEGPDRHVAVAHQPAPGLPQRETGYAMQFQQSFFDLLQRETVKIACPEDKVTADETVTLRP